jgi:hypothetical protein
MNGVTPLHETAKEGHLQICDTIFEKQHKPKDENKEPIKD